MATYTYGNAALTAYFLSRRHNSDGPSGLAYRQYVESHPGEWKEYVTKNEKNWSDKALVGLGALGALGVAAMPFTGGVSALLSGVALAAGALTKFFLRDAGEDRMYRDHHNKEPNPDQENLKKKAEERLNERTYGKAQNRKDWENYKEGQRLEDDSWSGMLGGTRGTPKKTPPSGPS